MKKFLLLLSLATSLVFGLTAIPVFAQTGPAATVNLMSHAFNPTDVNIPVGGRVVWNNVDAALHTVTSKPGENSVWGSGDLSPNQSYNRVFTASGTYNYVCNYHSWMTGRVIVGSGVSAPLVPAVPQVTAPSVPALSSVPSTGGSAPVESSSSSSFMFLLLTAAIGAGGAAAVGARVWSKSRIK